MKYRISDVASINESSISKSTYIGSVNYVDTSSVISGNFNGYRHYPSISEAPSRARRLVSKEDTVISTVRPNMKHVGFISSKSDCIYSTGFAVVSPKKDKIDPLKCPTIIRQRTNDCEALFVWLNIILN